MSRIAAAFNNKKAFIPFITAGDPTIATTKQVIQKAVAAGASLIEIGIPFSDPVAEGPAIQQADERALSNGINVDDIFQMVQDLRIDITTPFVLMTYLNPVFVYGVDKFMARCQEVGIDGIIVPDMPFEEKHVISGACKQYGVEHISMVAPSSDERIHKIAKEATGFLYVVSSLGVTGVRSNISTNIADIIKKIREVSSIPCAIGFGISTPEQAKEISRVADGVIVGSAIITIIAEKGTESPDAVYHYINKMVLAMENDSKIYV